MLLSVLREPERLGTLALSRWDLLLRVARQTGMLPRLAVEVRNRDDWPRIPCETWPALRSALVMAERHECVVRWEFNRLELALRALPGPVVLLKGAAYLAAGLPAAQGRIYADVDLLVPRAQLAEAQRLLQSHGWREAEIDPRDAEYFRAWLHELPPLVHRRRRTMLDVHHTILPLTDKLQVDPEKLWAESVEVPGMSLRVLQPADMVLHSAAHLFRNGDFSLALRDLYDLDGLLKSFSLRPDFWDSLVERAEAHNLQLPCYCGLRYVSRYFQTPLGPAIEQAMRRWSPGAWRLKLLDKLVDRALTPRELDRPDRGRERALNLLAHWPVPHWRAMFTWNFWGKRFPRWGNPPERKPGGKPNHVERETQLPTFSQSVGRAPEKPD